jgi:hypothetical protein
VIKSALNRGAFYRFTSLLKIDLSFYIEDSHMVTVFSYIGLLVGALVTTLALYIGLLKIKLI